MEMVEAQGQVSESPSAKEEGRKTDSWVLLTKAAKYGQQATARSRQGQV